MVVRPFRSRERSQIERIHDRQVEECGPGQVGFDEAAIVGNHVVPHHAIRPFRERVEPPDSLFGGSCITHAELDASAQGPDVPDPPICAHLKIERQAPLDELGERHR